MTTAKYILIAIMAVAVNSCTKDKADEENINENEPPMKIHDELDAFLFDSGCWWKYSNGIITDCTYIDESVLSIKTLSNGAISVDHDCLTSEYISSENGAYTEETYAAIITRATKESGWVFCTNIAVGESNQNIDYIDNLDTLSVNGTDYLKVRKIFINSDFFIPKDMIFYYCEGVGIVKKEILENGNVTETWDLIDSDVSLFPY